MAGASRNAKNHRPTENDDQKKLARLRDQRLAAQAVREAAGAWGEISLGGSTPVPTRAVFLHCWKGPPGPHPTQIQEAPGPGRTPPPNQSMTARALPTPLE